MSSLFNLGQVQGTGLTVCICVCSLSFYIKIARLFYSTSLDYTLRMFERYEEKVLNINGFSLVVSNLVDFVMF